MIGKSKIDETLICWFVQLRSCMLWTMMKKTWNMAKSRYYFNQKQFRKIWCFATKDRWRDGHDRQRDGLYPRFYGNINISIRDYVCWSVGLSVRKKVVIAYGTRNGLLGFYLIQIEMGHLTLCSLVPVSFRTGGQGRPTPTHTQHPTQSPSQHRHIHKKVLKRSFSHFSTRAYGPKDGQTELWTDGQSLL